MNTKKADKAVNETATLMTCFDPKIKEPTPEELMLVELVGTEDAFWPGMRTASMIWMTPLSVKMSLRMT